MAIGPAHSSHSDIALIGMGRFSAWRDGWLYFSSSDNSDPNLNGRSYALDLKEEMLPAATLGLKTNPGLEQFPSRLTDYSATIIRRELDKVNHVTSRYQHGSAEIAHADVAFLSIMCSGRTWVRYFLQTYLEDVYGADLSLRPASIPRGEHWPSICFTHDFLSVFESIPTEPWIVFEPLLLERPLLYLSRDVRDVAVSWFYYIRSSQPKLFADHLPSGKLTDFIDSPIFGIERLAAVHKLFRSFFLRHPGPKMMLTYEDLHGLGVSEFKRILEFVVGSKVDELALNSTYKKASFKEMQNLEIKISQEGKASEYLRLGVKNWSGDVNDLKVRAGKIGRFRAEVPHLDIPAILETRYPLTADVLGLERN